VKSKLSPSLFLSTLLVVALMIVILPFGLAQGATTVNGIIDSDTVWTQAGSPYTLTGNVLVEHGVTLTVEPGATVNLNGYYIRVNGTLTARGTAADRITFSGGQITFTSVGNDWNEQADSGCIIEYAIIDQTASVYSDIPIKIANTAINGYIEVTSSTIINNSINHDIKCHTCVVSNNNVMGTITLGSVSLGVISAPPEASIVYDNTVEGSINSGSPQGVPQIFNNTVTTGGISCSGYGSIFNNYVHDCQTGISLSSVRVFGGYLACYATVQNNLVVDNTYGIEIYLASLDGPVSMVPTVQNNTIARNSVGLTLSIMYYKAPIIQFNNLQDNSDYNFYLAASNDVNASYNWWGTTNQTAIANSIYDYYQDFNLGKVNYTPFLAEPNPQTPIIPEFPTIVLLTLLLVATMLASVCLQKKKHVLKIALKRL
jgi:hypothetical protein